MNTFTVQQVADILKTNPETVRRWIRSGKLKAEKTSNKTGNVILESSLENFGKIMPKYNKLIANNLISSSPSSALIGAATVLIDSIIGVIYKGKQDEINKAKIDFNELHKLIVSEIETRKKSIVEKEKTLKMLQKEIDTEKENLEELNGLLSTIVNRQHDK